uniref:Uncharacterized protein n=1 Tax=Myoviridae sp. ctjhW4 TaxID=2825162 RepID=A0A8S5PRK4_9CAUD|nr:MAG TPA: hypothetical protein [Myoviridae sp. ctjhW4]
MFHLSVDYCNQLYIILYFFHQELNAVKYPN